MMANETDNRTPARRWREDAAKPTADITMRLRLAAMAGHMASDRVAARRAALVDLLADGRPNPREAIWSHVAQQVGSDCWGKRPAEALLRDVKALRHGGVRVAYSRKPGLEGYYLQFPPLVAPQAGQFHADDRAWVEHIRGMSVPQKLETAFAAADFALRQKRLILHDEQPEWAAERVEREARRQVFGV